MLKRIKDIYYQVHGQKVFPKGLKKIDREIPLLVSFIRFGVYLILFTPLIFSAYFFYFPCLAPKTLYFMGVLQVVFFAWVYLIIFNKKYRPHFNLINFSLTLFFIVLVFSSVFGLDPSHSFWSNFVRMSGLLLWCHLFGFFFVISSVFKKKSDWENIFKVSVFVALLVTLWNCLEFGGLEGFQLSLNYSPGSTLGNSSFMGTYLLFNIFLGLYLGLKNSGWRKICFGASSVLMMLPLLFSGARASYLSVFFGLVLLGSLYLIFITNKKWLRFLGKAFLIFIAIFLLVGAISLFQQKSFVREKLINAGMEPRFVVWQEAWQSFKERPLLGWGLENFNLAFYKHFNPSLLAGDSCEEVWFDKAHNIIFEILATCGILGLISYLGIFVSALYILFRKYFQKKISFFAAFFPLVILVAYFLQNLTVFDTVSSYIMFLLILGFVSQIADMGEKRKEKIDGEDKEKKTRNHFLRKLLLVAAAILSFYFSFFQFVLWPLKTDGLIPMALRAKTQEDRLKFYQKALKTSPMGKYQAREVFAQHSIEIIKKNPKGISKNLTEKELNFLAYELEKSVKESPLNFKSVLQLAQLYNTYSLFDSKKISLAEKYGREAIKISPTSQFGYWVLARTKVLEKDFNNALFLTKEAINLEPRALCSYKTAIEIAKKAGNLEKAHQIFQAAIKVNPNWEKELRKILIEKSSSI